MAAEPQRIDFEQFAGNLQVIFDQVSEGNRPVVVERGGESFRLEKERPPDIWAGYDPEKARQALNGAVGILKGMDTQELINDIYEQREQNSAGRPA